LKSGSAAEPRRLGQPPFTRRFKDCGELIAPIFASSWLVNPANLPLARTMLATLERPSVGDAPTQ
jgi:hypothetical protein